MRYRLDAEALAAVLTNRCGLRRRPTVLTNPESDRFPQQLDSLTEECVLLDGHYAPRPSMPRIVRALVERENTVIVLTGAEDGALTQALAFSGAQHFVDTSESLVGLEGLISGIFHGNLQQTQFSARLWTTALTSDRVELTKRESDVARAYCSADEPSVLEVAERLHIAVSTVDTHLANIRKKLGSQSARNRLALRSALLERGWID